MNHPRRFSNRFFKHLREHRTKRICKGNMADQAFTKERALAQGIFNSGAAIGGIISIPLIGFLAVFMSWQMILSLPAFALSGALFETIAWQNLDWQPILAILYQGIIIAGFGFMINAILMQRYSPTLMVSFGFVSPISGVFLSLWLLGEDMSWQIAAGMILVAFGLYVIAKD